MGILKALVIAVTGTLPHETSQLKKWIEANDGRYSPHIRNGVTHLITGVDAWKKSTDPVQTAIEVGAFVVSYDWLEDSLQKKRKLAETKYTWEHLWQEKKRRKQMKKIGLLADTKKFNDGCEEAKKATGTGTSKSRTVIRKPKPSKSFFFANVVNVPYVSAADDLKRRRNEREAAKVKKAEETATMNAERAKSDRAISCAPSIAHSLTLSPDAASPPSPATSRTLSTTSSQTANEPQAKKPSLKDLYHYYLDTTGFEYKILLIRCDLRAHTITKYRLSILESHTKPHVYCTFVEYILSGASAAGAGEAACIQALLDYNKTFPDDSSEDFGTIRTSLDNIAEGQVTAMPNAPSQAQQVAAHLQSLLNSTAPSPTLPYKALIAPMNSPFSLAWRVFRHCFRDLTLLSWEERFDISKILYKARAQHFAIEPFVYVRPKFGLPLGLRVQEAGLFMNQQLATINNSEAPPSGEKAGKAQEQGYGNEEGYRHNSFNLPSLTHPLGAGVIGTALARDAAQQKAEEQKRSLAQAGSAQSTSPAKKAKKPNFSRPLFNGVTGRPTTDAWDQPMRGAMSANRGRGAGNGLMGGGTVRRKLFPSERRF